MLMRPRSVAMAASRRALLPQPRPLPRVSWAHLGLVSAWPKPTPSAGTIAASTCSACLGSTRLASVQCRAAWTWCKAKTSPPLYACLVSVHSALSPCCVRSHFVVSAAQISRLLPLCKRLGLSATLVKKFEAARVFEVADLKQGDDIMPANDLMVGQGTTTCARCPCRVLILRLRAVGAGHLRLAVGRRGRADAFQGACAGPSRRGGYLQHGVCERQAPYPISGWPQARFAIANHRDRVAAAFDAVYGTGDAVAEARRAFVSGVPVGKFSVGQLLAHCQHHSAAWNAGGEAPDGDDAADDATPVERDGTGAACVRSLPTLLDPTTATAGTKPAGAIGGEAKGVEENAHAAGGDSDEEVGACRCGLDVVATRLLRPNPHSVMCQISALGSIPSGWQSTRTRLSRKASTMLPCSRCVAAKCSPARAAQRA